MNWIVRKILINLCQDTIETIKIFFPYLLFFTLKYITLRLNILTT